MKHLAWGLAFLALTSWFIGAMGKDLWSDINHSKVEWELVGDAKISRASCQSKLGVTSFCDITASSGSLAIEQMEFKYFHLGGIGDETVAVLRTTNSDHSEQSDYSTSYGLANLTRRII